VSGHDIGFEHHRPLARRALWARLALVVVIAVDVVAVLSDLREISLLDRFETDLPTEEELEESDRRQVTVAIAQTVVFFVAAFFFIRWLHRAYKNIPLFGAQYPRFSTATAIWSWFVPILNWWRPKQVINDVWRASDPEAPPDQGSGWQERSPPLLYGVWWFFWVVLNLVYNADLRYYLRADTLEELQNSARLTLFADLLSVVGGVLALLVVRRTTARQEARAEVLRQDMASGESEGGDIVAAPR
jgi:ABC-type Fe3+ transport system permease subunit